MNVYHLPLLPLLEPTWAVVPARDFSRAKSRLAGVLEPADRAAFARSMLEHVLGVLLRCPGLAGTLVVTDSLEVASCAEAVGARTVAQPYAAPLGAVVDAGLAAVRALGAASALVLMADLPGLEPDEVGALLSRLRGAEVVIAPDERGDGTNALGIRFTGPIADPDALEHTAFGNPDSFVRHCTWARRTGRRLEVLRRPGLELDVDLPEDLARMGAWMPARVPEHRVSG